MMVILSIMLLVRFSSGRFLSLPPLELVPWFREMACCRFATRMDSMSPVSAAALCVLERCCLALCALDSPSSCCALIVPSPATKDRLFPVQLWPRHPEG